MLRAASLIIVLMSCCQLGSAAEGPLDVEREKERLVSGSTMEQQDAMARLKSGGSRSGTALLDVIEHSDSTAKARAAEVLGGILAEANNRTPETFATLERLAAEKDYSTVDSVMRTLVKAKGDDRAHSIIKRLATSHVNESIRGKAASSLTVVSNNDPADVPVLSELLKDPSEFVRLRAAGSLGILGKKDGLPVCLDVLNRPPEKEEARGLQLEAAIAAGKIGDSRALPILRKIGQSDSYGPAKGRALIAISTIELHGLKSKAAQIDYLKAAIKDRATSRWAGYELQNMNVPEAISALKEVSGDSTDRDAAGEAAEALARIGATQK